MQNLMDLHRVVAHDAVFAMGYDGKPNSSYTIYKYDVQNE